MAEEEALGLSSLTRSRFDNQVFKWFQHLFQAAGFWVLSVDLAANDAADANVLVSFN